jgi:hypothetical protein
MAWKKLARACWMFPLLLPEVASALVVEVQGVRLEPEMAGASCVDIAGVYPGVRIEADRPGQTPRVCHNAGRVDSISIANATLIATPPVKKDILIKFEHEFPPGVNGKIMARAKLQGFFATENGVGVPTGDRLGLSAFFSQGPTSDVIAEPLSFTVGDSLEAAIFDYSVKKQYLIAGPRALKGEIKITFSGLGHKLTLPEKCLIALDSGATFEDKLEAMDIAEGAPLPVEGAEPGGAAGGEGGGSFGGARPPGAGPGVPPGSADLPGGKLPPLPNLPPLEPLPAKP